MFLMDDEDLVLELMRVKRTGRPPRRHPAEVDPQAAAPLHGRQHLVDAAEARSAQLFMSLGGVHVDDEVAARGHASSPVQGGGAMS